MAPSRDSSSRPTKRLKIDFREEVTILVGSTEERFVAHRDVLRRSSNFFQSALKPEWQESQERKVELSDQDATAFSIYLNWLYDGIIDVWDNGEVLETHTTACGKEKENCAGRYERIIESYILGDYLGDSKFCNAMIDCYFDLEDATWMWPSTETCRLAFERLADTSKLRLLIVHQLTFGASYDSFASNIDELGPEIIREVALVAVKDLHDKVKTMDDRGRCYYHDHEDGDEKKCKAKKTGA